jgi:hypothetical protein
MANENNRNGHWTKNTRYAMGLLQTMTSRLNRPAEPAEPVVDFDDAGFNCAGESPWRATWSEVKRITAYKIDRVTVDEIRVDFALRDGTTRVITEESPGFDELMGELARHFPTVSGWRDRVVQPAFAPSVSVLYVRGD